jgi:hypothetical protein
MKQLFNKDYILLGVFLHGLMQAKIRNAMVEEVKEKGRAIIDPTFVFARRKSLSVPSSPVTQEDLDQKARAQEEQGGGQRVGHEAETVRDGWRSAGYGLSKNVTLPVLTSYIAPTNPISPLSIISRSTTLLLRSFCMESLTFFSATAWTNFSFCEVLGL